MPISEGTRDPAGHAEQPCRYPRPQHVNRGGLEEFDDRVVRYAQELAADIDHNAVVGRGNGDILLHTAVMVGRKADELDRRRAGRGRSLRARLSALLLVVFTVATTVTGGYLHSVWQIGLFAVFALAGLVSLALTWPGGGPQPDQRDGR